MAGEFIDGADDRIAFALGDGDGDDFVVEFAGLLGSFGLLLRGNGEGVLGFAGESVFFRQIFGGDPHVEVVEGAPQAVLDQGIDQFPVAHALAVAGVGQYMRGVGHGFLAPGDDEVGVAAGDGLSGQMYGLEPGAADLVDGHGGGLPGQPGLDGGLAGRVLAGPAGEHLAHDDFIHLVGGDADLFQTGADDQGTQIGGGEGGERTAESADGGAHGGEDDDIVHWVKPSLRWLFHRRGERVDLRYEAFTKKNGDLRKTEIPENKAIQG